MRLFEGAIGPTRLAQATATACLDSQQRLAFDCHLEPAQARQTGHVKLSGSLPLTFTNQPSAVVIRSFTHACPHSFAGLLLLPSIHPSICLSVCPSNHSFIHTFMHSFILTLFACLPLRSRMTLLAVGPPTMCQCFLKIWLKDTRTMFSPSATTCLFTVPLGRCLPSACGCEISNTPNTQLSVGVELLVSNCRQGHQQLHLLFTQD